MTLCKFWAQGNCRNGSNCRFEHPANTRTNSPNNQNNREPFGTARRNEKWNINVEDIKNDLTINRPNWILSAYGPGKDAPAALFKENEYSPEEVRWRFYEQRNAGNTQQADQEAISLWNKARTDMQNVANNASEVIRFMEDQERKRPNRYDFCRMDGTKSADEVARNAGGDLSSNPSTGAFGGSNAGGASTSNPFAKPAVGQTAFGQPSNLGAGQSAFGNNTTNPNPFSRPSFGAAAASTPSGFGQATPAFGQTSGIGQSAASNPFSKPAAPAFGQPAPKFGQSAIPSAFGQPATPSTFGQPTAPSAFGQPAAPSTFGQPAAPSTFGQPAVSTAFGKPSAPSAFGQPQSTAPSTQTTTAFGSKPAFGTSPFGTQQTSAPAFGKPGGFGGSGFGQQSSGIAQGSGAGFGSGGGFGQSGFGSGSGTAGFGSTRPSFGGNNNSTVPPPMISQAPETSMLEDGTSTEQRPASNQAAGPSFGTGVFGQKSQPDGLTVSSIQATSDGTNPLIGKPSKSLHYTETLGTLQSTPGPNGTISAYRGQRVQYLEKTTPTVEGNMVVTERFPVYIRPDGKGQERIWFPQGPSDATVQSLYNAQHLLDLQGPDSDYPDQIKEQYVNLFEKGMFEGGKIPLIPPQREWIAYDI